MKPWHILLLCCAVVVVLMSLSLLGRGCDTASEMAGQTVFNADKHVWTYEEFYRKWENYEQYKKQIGDAQAELDKLEAKGTTSGQRYDNLSNEMDGSRQMMRRIAAEYNKMSDVFYQDVWKGKELPKKLE